MTRIIVIGGGIAGLAAAHRIVELNNQKSFGIEVQLLEASPRLGGAIATERVGDFLVEAGPDSFITEKPWALRLCERIGLTSRLVSTQAAYQKIYVVHRGKLEPLPETSLACFISRSNLSITKLPFCLTLFVAAVRFCERMIEEMIVALTTAKMPIIAPTTSISMRLKPPSVVVLLKLFLNFRFSSNLSDKRLPSFLVNQLENSKSRERLLSLRTANQEWGCQDLEDQEDRKQPLLHRPQLLLLG